MYTKKQKHSNKRFCEAAKHIHKDRGLINNNVKTLAFEGIKTRNVESFTMSKSEYKRQQIQAMVRY